jgi:hypothetical protein
VRGPIVTSSHLHASQDAVWAGASSARGINDEFWPLLRMTASRSLRENGLAQVELGKRICRSWVLLLGVVPVDYDDITLVRLDPPRGFLERSTMLSQRAWEHERSIEPAPDGADGCIVTDTIRYEPRLPVPDLILRRLYAAIFRYRHHRLRKRYRGMPIPQAR